MPLVSRPIKSEASLCSPFEVIEGRVLAVTHPVKVLCNLPGVGADRTEDKQFA